MKLLYGITSFLLFSIASCEVLLHGDGYYGTLSWIATFAPSFSTAALSMTSISGPSFSFMGFSAIVDGERPYVVSEFYTDHIFLYFPGVLKTDSLFVTVTGSYKTAGTEAMVASAILITDDTTATAHYLITATGDAVPQITGSMGDEGTVTWVETVLPNWSQAEFFLDFLSVSNAHILGADFVYQGTKITPNTFYEDLRLITATFSADSVMTDHLYMTASASYAFNSYEFDASYMVTANEISSTGGSYTISWPKPTQTHSPEITASGNDGSVTWTATVFPTWKLATFEFTSAQKGGMYSLVDFRAEYQGISTSASSVFNSETVNIEFNGFKTKTDPLHITITGVYNRTLTEYPLEASITLKIDELTTSTLYSVTLPTTELPEINGAIHEGTITWIETIKPDWNSAYFSVGFDYPSSAKMLGFDVNYQNTRIENFVGTTASEYVQASIDFPEARTDPIYLTASASYDAYIFNNTLQASFSITADESTITSGTYTASIPTAHATAVPKFDGSAHDGSLTWFATFFPEWKSVNVVMNSIEGGPYSFGNYSTEFIKSSSVLPTSTSIISSISLASDSEDLYFQCANVNSETLIVTMTGSYDHTNTALPIKASVTLSADGYSLEFPFNITLAPTSLPEITGTIESDTIYWTATVFPEFSNAQVELIGEDLSFIGYDAEKNGASTNGWAAPGEASLNVLFLGSTPNSESLVFTASAVCSACVLTSAYEAEYTITADTTTILSGTYSIGISHTIQTPQITGSVDDHYLYWTASILPDWYTVDYSMINLENDFAFVDFEAEYNGATSNATSVTISLNSIYGSYGDILSTKSLPLYITATGFYNSSKSEIEASYSIRIDYTDFTGTYTLTSPIASSSSSGESSITSSSEKLSSTSEGSSHISSSSTDNSTDKSYSSTYITTPDTYSSTYNSKILTSTSSDDLTSSYETTIITSTFSGYNSSTTSALLTTPTITGTLVDGEPFWIVKVPGSLGSISEISLTMTKEGSFDFDSGSFSIDETSVQDSDIMITDDLFAVEYYGGVDVFSTATIVFGGKLSVPVSDEVTATGELTLTFVEESFFKRSLSTYELVFSIELNESLTGEEENGSSVSELLGNASDEANKGTTSLTTTSPPISGDILVDYNLSTLSNGNGVSSTTAVSTSSSDDELSASSTQTDINTITTTDNSLIRTSSSYCLSSSSKDKPPITIISVTSCSENKCSTNEITTGITIITSFKEGTAITYTTYCPISSELKPTTSSKIGSKVGASLSAESVTPIDSTYEGFGNRVAIGTSLFAFAIALLYI